MTTRHGLGYNALMSESDASTPLALQVEAALMISDRPLPAARIAEAIGEIQPKQINDAIEALNGFYETHGRSFRVESVAGGWQMMTLPQFGEVLKAILKTKAATRLSPAAMETLAIIAYKQPALRAEIESIRGVASGEVVRSLMERKLVKIVGRAEELGRPMLYGTTRKFLELFGLANLKDLPPVEQWRPKLPDDPPPPTTEPQDQASTESDQEPDHATESRT
jgi:segregation and condensation protein B